jgi:hypothetical protein
MDRVVSEASLPRSSPYRTAAHVANTRPRERRDPLEIAQRVALRIVLVWALLRVASAALTGLDFEVILAGALAITTFRLAAAHHSTGTGAISAAETPEL